MAIDSFYAKILVSLIRKACHFLKEVISSFYWRFLTVKPQSQLTYELDAQKNHNISNVLLCLHG
jgi:hypothetical protein